MVNPAIITLQESSPFEFDRELSPGAVIQPTAERKKTKWSEEEVEEIRAQAYAAGEEAARMAEEAEVSRQIAAGSALVGERLGALLENLRGERAQLREEAANISLAIARKIVPALMETAPTAEIEAVMDHALMLLRDEPRVVIHAAPEQLPALEPRLNAMAQEQGFEGTLVMRATQDVEPGDVRVEWAKGAITRDTPALDQSIEDIVRTYLSAPESDDTGQADFFALLGTQ